MPWLTFLHIVALVSWCASLLYLAAALAASARPGTEEGTTTWPLRTLFTLVATPAALLSIASGTAVFLVQSRLGVWLVAKLTAVTLLVLVHAGCGVLVIRLERGDAPASVRRRATAAAAAAMGLILLISWLVLAKPL